MGAFVNRVNLHGRVLKQSIVGVEHFLTEEEEPLPGQSPIVQAHLAFEFYPQFGLEMFDSIHGGYNTIRVF